VRISADGISFGAISLRLANPPEFDLMARISGLRLRDRKGGWHGEPFTAYSWRPSACTSTPTTTMDRRSEMSSAQVDKYVAALEEPMRGTLQTLRRTILEVVPEADQVISYRVPAFRLRGQTIAGFAAFKSHLSYLPFSGSVLGALGGELEGYKMTKSSLHFPVDRPLPKALVQKLIEVRLAEVASRP
jgi:uncharacterized protein YdhG (YjbR/CyaY superfamily)